MKVFNKASLLATSMLVGVGASIAAGVTAIAQEPEVAERVVVTGSRIPKRDIEASSPLTTVDAVDLSISNTVNAEQFLSTLPQAVPGFDATSNNPGIGEATVNLRGLGSQRTLVLVNGRRYVYSNQNPGVVDLNTIPASLIESVEIVTGGQSAVYGSDAMAGVVNFQLKDDYEGVTYDASYEITEEWDGSVIDTSVLMGANTDDGRGNAVFYTSYTYREAVLADAREETFFTLNDTGTGFGRGGSAAVPSTAFIDAFGTTDFGALGISTIPAGDYFANAGTFQAGDFALGDACSLEGTEVYGPDIVDDPDDPEFDVDPVEDWFTPFCGSTFGGLIGDGGSLIPLLGAGPNVNLYNFAPINYLQIPQERWSVFGSGTYEITDSIEAYAQGIFVSSQTEQALASTPVVTTLTVNIDNPFLQTGLMPAVLSQHLEQQRQAAIDTFDLYGDADPTNDPEDPFEVLFPHVDPGNGFFMDRDGNGVEDLQIYAARRMLELGPRISDIRNDSFQVQGGFRGDFLGGDFSWDTFASFGQASSTIIQTGNVSVSAWQAQVLAGNADLFTEGGLSQDVVDAVSKTGAIVGVTEQIVLSGNVAGDLAAVKSPLADTPVGVSGGVEYRQEEIDVLPDSVLGPDVAGFNQAPAVFGRFDVYEAFGELYVPLVEGLPFAEEISVNGAYRISDYSTVGEVESYAAGGRWEVIPGYSLRAQYQRAVRAPNIGELYQPLVNGFPAVADPCSGGDNGKFDGYDAATKAIVSANCIADGVPGAQVGASFQLNVQIEGLFGGNPNLDEETSDTYTIGFIAQPIDGLDITVDYFNIEIADVIGTVPSQTIFNNCYELGDPLYCGLIDRRANGAVDIFRSNAINSAFMKASGVDLTVDYSVDLADLGLPSSLGTFGVYFLGTWTNEAQLQADSGSPINDCAGLYGATCGQPTPEWKFNTRFDWESGPFAARLRWRYIGEVTDDLIGLDPTFDPNELFIKGVEAQSYFDLTGYYQLNDSVQMALGVQNLFEPDYVFIGSASAEQSNTYPATYDTLGRTFFGRLTVNF